jgi:hypothetical protein
MFSKLKYILPGKAVSKEAAVETVTKHTSTLAVEYKPDNSVRRFAWHSEYDPSDSEAHLKPYKDILDWFTKPSKQRSRTFTLIYAEGASVLVRDYIVGMTITKGTKQVKVETTKKIEE